MLTETIQVYITDKTGKKYFKTLCGTAYAQSEVRNMQRHLDQANAHPAAYKFLDVASATIVNEQYTK